MSAHRTLWQAVLLRAVRDALGDHEAREPHAQRDAEAWIRGGGRDFRLVCDMAGFDPAHIREAFVSGRINAALMVREGVFRAPRRRATAPTRGKTGQGSREGGNAHQRASEGEGVE